MDIAMDTLPDGIPLERDYRKVMESDSFKAMEQSSDSFLSANKAILKDYMKKWVYDPLHQWSRQWEYPFVYSRVKQMALFNKRLNVLDAGSGITFFPYFLNACFDHSRIYCCDYDKILSKIFYNINEGKSKVVEFLNADLKNIPYANESFDMVYCISVLEHTNDYDKITDQFYKILKPGGTLVVTIDISLDGTWDIDIGRATTLLTSLVNRFDKNKDFSYNLNSHLSRPGVFTTVTARNIDPGLLPWKAPSFLYRLKSFFATGRFGLWPPPLTVYCLSLTK